MSSIDRNQKSLVVFDIKPMINKLIAASEYYTVSRDVMCTVQFTEKTPHGVMRSTWDDVVMQSEPITKLDTKRAFNILLELVKETVDRFVRYRMPSLSVDVIAENLTGSAAPTQLELNMVDDFLCMDIVDEVVVDITHIACGHVMENPWRQWDVVNTPNLIIMVGGEDHRVEEWYRQNPQWDNDSECQLILDIRSIRNYLNSVMRELNESALGIISPDDLLVDGLGRLYGHLEIRRENNAIYQIADIPTKQFFNLTPSEFYEQYTRQLIKAVIDVNIKIHTSRQSFYRVDVTSDGHLKFIREPLPVTMAETYYNEIKAAIDSGDWVPERERRELMHYERANRRSV